LDLVYLAVLKHHVGDWVDYGKAGEPLIGAISTPGKLLVTDVLQFKGREPPFAITSWDGRCGGAATPQ
jgi:hypothetical protein